MSKSHGFREAVSRWIVSPETGREWVAWVESMPVIATVPAPKGEPLPEGYLGTHVGSPVVAVEGTPPGMMFGVDEDGAAVGALLISEVIR
jgi:hypothetical protein